MGVFPSESLDTQCLVFASQYPEHHERCREWSENTGARGGGFPSPPRRRRGHCPEWYLGHGPRQFTAKDAPGGDRGNPREEGGPRGCGAPVAHKARVHRGGRADSGDVCSGVDDFRQGQGSKYFRLCGEY